MIVVRPLHLPDDRVAVERIDTSFSTDAAWAVHAAPDGFALVLRPLREPRVKRYAFAIDELTSASSTIVAVLDGVVSAVAAIEVQAWNRRAVLSHLYVDRDARGKGLGRALVAELEMQARAREMNRLWVETQNVNTTAVSFYRRCGYTLCGLDTALYDPDAMPDEIALFLVKQLA